jgi:hypothetical protein
MRRPLHLHPDSRCAAVRAVEVEALRPAPGRLSLRYSLTGDTAALVIPPPAAPERADDLWRTTCFEAFLAAPDAAAYCELNFAPSTRWAAYRFDGYRQGMAPLDLPAPPAIAVRRAPDGLELAVDLQLPDAPAGPWRLGLTAVIDTTGEGIAHWAIAHPPGRADFHAAAGFDLSLPEPVIP